ncbi:MAG: hypothetical protein ABIM89_19275 [Mycobacteriales bacterium]
MSPTYVPLSCQFGSERKCQLCWRGHRQQPRAIDAANRRGVSGATFATLLMLAFGPTRMRSVVEGVSRAEVEAAFPRWEMLSVEPADTAGLGWPLNRTAPQWYRLRRPA